LKSNFVDELGIVFIKIIQNSRFMSDLKTQIFSVIKKRPHSICTSFDAYEVAYVNDNSEYIIYPTKCNNGTSFVCTLRVSKRCNNDTLPFADETIRKVELTEKEYMDLKWAIEAWKEQIEEQDLEEFKDFAESEPGTMDDLLHD